MPSNSTIFIVDDDSAVLSSLQVLFESVGLRVEVFDSGKAFLESINPLRKGCLIIDYSMPGMNGLELRAQLNKRHITLPTILLTGHADVPIAVRALKTGIVDVVEKPFEVQSLLQKVCDALASVSKPASGKATSSVDTLPAPPLAAGRARQILTSMADGVIVTDRADRIEYLNPTAEKLTGWQHGEAWGRPAADVFKLLDRLEEAPADSPVQESDGDDVNKYRVLVRRDGRTVTITRSAAQVRDDMGQEQGTVIVFRDITLTQRKIRDLTYAATHDPLTGLVNRREFMRRLEQTLKGGSRKSSAHALCYLDLDRFKYVNDTAGHHVGDVFLCRIAALLREKIRARDTLARLGGDEFSLILEHCPLPLAQRIAANLVETVERFRFDWEDKVLTVGLSIGVIAVDGSGRSIEQVLQAADGACYAAKRQGGARVYVEAGQLF